ncbi:MAG: GlsB/YeaQ/YmgE family stress response membrane protein [Anaerolineae bacterium]|jgi:uncharacterized membrane protein YeaQ/YmgE (transglycosylase-associated protein family)|nr:GlsB/YeaQ/YmgE family stress response membrane protein [Anaerolineae bacterium]
MDATSILIWIVVGAIAGWLASMVMKTNHRQGLVEDIIVGIVGGLLGGWLLGALGVNAGVTGFNLGSLLTAFVGAIVLLALLRVVRRA